MEKAVRRIPVYTVIAAHLGIACLRYPLCTHKFLLGTTPLRILLANPAMLTGIG